MVCAQMNAVREPNGDNAQMQELFKRVRAQLTCPPLWTGVDQHLLFGRVRIAGAVLSDGTRLLRLDSILIHFDGHGSHESDTSSRIRKDAHDPGASLDLFHERVEQTG